MYNFSKTNSTPPQLSLPDINFQNQTYNKAFPNSLNQQTTPHLENSQSSEWLLPPSQVLIRNQLHQLNPNQELSLTSENNPTPNLNSQNSSNTSPSRPHNNPENGDIAEVVQKTLQNLISPLLQIFIKILFSNNLTSKIEGAKDLGLVLGLESEIQKTLETLNVSSLIDSQ